MSKGKRGSSSQYRQLLAQASKQASTAVAVEPTCDASEAIDSQVERFLQLHGIRYAPKTMFPIGAVNEKASLSNQARDVPLIPENVDRYAQAIKQGDYLPPLIVFKQGDAVVIVDGNNRYAGHKRAGSQFFPAFLIAEDTPSELIALLTVAANNNHGETPSIQWRLKQAAYLVSIGYSTDQAADAAGVTKHRLGDFQATMRADARAKDMKISGFTDLAASSRMSLGRLPLDSVFYQAARTVIDTEMGTEDVRLLIKGIREQSTEAAMIEHIGKVAGDRKLEAKKREAGGKGKVKSPVMSLNAALGMIMNVDGGAIARQVLTDTDRQLIIRRLDAAGEKLIELQLALTESRLEESA